MSGDPEQYVSTSYVERQRLSLRMGQRRFARLTNGFCKKFDNHVAAVALPFYDHAMRGVVTEGVADRYAVGMSAAKLS